MRFGLGAWMVVVAVLCAGVSVAILVVAQVRERREVRVYCINNLKHLAESKLDVWDHGTFEGVYYMTTNLNASPLPPTNLVCPLAEGQERTLYGSYSLNDMTTPPTCRIRPEEHRLP
jgi:hypothetical protein